MLLDTVASRYHRLPSEIIDPYGELDAHTAYALNVACAVRAQIEESNAIKRAREDAENPKDDPNIVEQQGGRKPMSDTRRERIAKQNQLMRRGKGWVGGIAGNVGEYDPTLAKEYEKLGGTLPTANQNDGFLDRYLAKRNKQKAEANELRKAVRGETRIDRIKRKRQEEAHAKRVNGPADGQP